MTYLEPNQYATNICHLFGDWDESKINKLASSKMRKLKRWQAYKLTNLQANELTDDKIASQDANSWKLLPKIYMLRCLQVDMLRCWHVDMMAW